jgi:hypothetical protein
MSVGEIDWEVFAAHLRAEGQEHVLDEYPEYAEYLRSKAGPEEPAPAPAPAEAPAPEAPVQVIERIVERQVLVIRCKFCQGLSPVELEKCKSCGAEKFY